MQGEALLQLVDVKAADPVIVTQVLWALNAMLSQPAICNKLVSETQVGNCTLSTACSLWGKKIALQLASTTMPGMLPGRFILYCFSMASLGLALLLNRLLVEASACGIADHAPPAAHTACSTLQMKSILAALMHAEDQHVQLAAAIALDIAQCTEPR